MTKTYHISMVHVSIKYHSIVFMYKDCFVHCIKNKFKCSLIVKHVTPQKVVNIKRGNTSILTLVAYKNSSNNALVKMEESKKVTNHPKIKQPKY
ncbi:hypothetical protein Hanom_Chr00s057518g01783581 [Helianthus anomalus]